MNNLFIFVGALSVSTLINAQPSEPAQSAQLLTTVSIKVSNVRAANPALTDSDCVKMTDANLINIKMMETNGFRQGKTSQNSILVDDFNETTFDHGLYAVNARYRFHYERDNKPMTDYVYVRGVKMSYFEDLAGIFSLVDSINQDIQCRGNVTIQYR